MTDPATSPIPQDKGTPHEPELFVPQDSVYLDPAVRAAIAAMPPTQPVAELDSEPSEPIGAVRTSSGSLVDMASWLADMQRAYDTLSVEYDPKTALRQALSEIATHRTAALAEVEYRKAVEADLRAELERVVQERDEARRQAESAVADYRRGIRANAQPSMYEDRLAELTRERDEARARLAALFTGDDTAELTPDTPSSILARVLEHPLAQERLRQERAAGWADAVAALRAEGDRRSEDVAAFHGMTAWAVYVTAADLLAALDQGGET